MMMLALLLLAAADISTATLAEAFVYISLTQYVDHFLAYAETEYDVPAAPSFAHAHD